MIKREWITEKSLEQHLRKHVLESSTDEKNKWKKVYQEYTKESLESINQEKQKMIYKDESLSIYGNVENKKAKKIFLYEDYKYNIKSINLTRDDGLVVGEDEQKIKTCYFKVNKLLLDTEIIALLFKLLDKDLEDLDKDVIDIKGIDMYFYHNDNLYNKYHSVIVNNTKKLYLLKNKLTSEEQEKERIKTLERKRKNIGKGIFIHFLENQVSFRKDETKQIYELMINYLKKDETKVNLEKTLKENLKFALKNLSIEINNSNEPVCLIENYIIFNMIAFVINNEINKINEDVIKFLVNEVKNEKLEYDFNNLINNYKRIKELLL